MAVAWLSACGGPVCEPGLVFCTQNDTFLARCDKNGDLHGFDCAAQCKKAGFAEPAYCGFSAAQNDYACICGDGKTVKP